MATDRKDTKVTRLDLRIPNDIYAQVEEIAKANNAPSHHISGNIILSPTLLKLVSLGIRSLSGNYSELADITPNISQLSDTSSTRIDRIEGDLAKVKKSLSELSRKLSVYIPDTMSDTVPDTIPDSMPDTVPDTIPDIVPDSKDGELEPAAIAPTPPQTEQPSYEEIPTANVEIPSANPDPKPEPNPILKPVTGLGGEEMSYGVFFKTIGMENPRGRNITNAQLALDRANELNILGWEYDSVKFKFYREPPTE